MKLPSITLRTFTLSEAPRLSFDAPKRKRTWTTPAISPGKPASWLTQSRNPLPPITKTPPRITLPRPLSPSTTSWAGAHSSWCRLPRSLDKRCGCRSNAVCCEIRRGGIFEHYLLCAWSPFMPSKLVVSGFRWCVHPFAAHPASVAKGEDRYPSSGREGISHPVFYHRSCSTPSL